MSVKMVTFQQSNVKMVIFVDSCSFSKIIGDLLFSSPFFLCIVQVFYTEYI